MQAIGIYSRCMMHDGSHTQTHTWINGSKYIIAGLLACEHIYIYI